MVTQEKISEWFNEGVFRGAHYMIIACDTFDHTDYPVYCNSEDVHKKYEEYRKGNMSRVMEVYSLLDGKDEQVLTMHRVCNLPAKTARHDE